MRSPHNYRVSVWDNTHICCRGHRGAFCIGGGGGREGGVGRGIRVDV